MSRTVAPRRRAETAVDPDADRGSGASGAVAGDVAAGGALASTSTSMSLSERLPGLRKQARRAGFTIQSRVDRRRGTERRYRLLDRSTREVVAADLRDLDALTVELWWRIRERTNQPAPTATREWLATCPECGTGRIGALRFCRSCGWDFEPAHERAEASVVPTTTSAMPVMKAAPEVTSLGDATSLRPFVLPGADARVVPPPGAGRDADRAGARVARRGETPLAGRLRSDSSPPAPAATQIPTALVGVLAVLIAAAVLVAQLVAGLFD